MFYLRLFPDQNFRRAIWTMVVVCCAAATSFFLATLLQCRPMSYAWTSWDGQHRGRCHNINIQTYAHASINIALDFVVLGMPLTQILPMKMRWAQKAIATMMFAIGFLYVDLPPFPFAQTTHCKTKPTRMKSRR